MCCLILDKIKVEIEQKQIAADKARQNILEARQKLIQDIIPLLKEFPRAAMRMDLEKEISW